MTPGFRSSQVVIHNEDHDAFDAHLINVYLERYNPIYSTQPLLLTSGRSSSKAKA